MNIARLLRRLKFKKSALVSAYLFANNETMLACPPAEVFIEPTNYCNLRCSMCPQSIGLKREKGYMSIESFQKILEEIVKLKTLKITFHFAGESLLNKDIFDMVGLAKKNHLYTRMHTNATLLSEENGYRLIKSGLDELSISFDDSRKEVYESMRINASFEKTLFNIRFFLKLKKRLRSASPHTILQRIGLDNGINRDNRIEDYKKLFKGLDVDEFKLIYTHNWAGNFQNPAETKNNPVAAQTPCLALWSRFAIGWDGKVYACCNEMNGRLMVGDLNKTSLSSIWNGQQMMSLRRFMLSGRYEEIEVCRNCDVLRRSEKPQLGSLGKGAAKILLFLERKINA